MNAPVTEIALMAVAVVTLFGGFWLIRRKAKDHADSVEVLLGMIAVLLFIISIGMTTLVRETRNVGSEIQKVQFNVNVKPGPSTTFDKVEVK